MATASKKIKDALSGLVNGKIWAGICPKNEDPDEWITFYTLYEAPSDHGDDTDTEWAHFMAVHWCKKGNVNFYSMRSQMRDKLKEAGFSIMDITPWYDNEAKVTHVIINCNIVDEEFDAYGTS